jgi:hypothetical protein
MIVRFKKLKIKKVVSILVLMILLIPIGAVSNNYLNKYELNRKVPNTENKIETNFFTAQIQKIGIYKKIDKVVIASGVVLKNGKIPIYSSNRTDTFIKTLYIQSNTGSEASLVEELNMDFSNLGMSIPDPKAKYFVFDLAFKGENLYVSYVVSPSNKSEYDEFRVQKIRIDTTTGEILSGEIFFSKSFGTRTYPNNPGWHDFQGRLSITEKNLYMSTGLIIASTYLGTYPNPEISGLSNNLVEDDKKFNFFGRVIQVDLFSGSSKVYAKGFRGPSGIVTSTINGKETVWVSDHGPRGGDELNLVIQGLDYGWPWVTYGKDYYQTHIKNQKYINTKFAYHEGYQKPAFFWTPSIAPSQMLILSNDLDSSNNWSKQDLILGTLKDKSLNRIKICEKKLICSIERVEIGSRVRDLDQIGNQIIGSTDEGQIFIFRK